ncbi:unnamed protein product [Rotaria sp. Silwood1]|nr:unnamed protein product [Rotaria sp. Silwood1]CAF1617304.1 unnamed protein product [Rotaria sp. Silwood1]CAF3736849.1 unnamed protein product [Rotaria sp. Silwood1]CAF3791434.1 unnamed protein product [Rotaria sp. Silwood1]CAF3825198.1 unnamed protein product [Rotaria sp. Silwood1]
MADAIDRTDSAAYSCSASSKDAATPSPTYLSPAALHIPENIVAYLQLKDKDSAKKDQIISDLLRNGRQALFKYRNEVPSEIFSAEQNYSTSEEDTLLMRLIKQSHWETWEIYLLNHQIILSYINKVKEENLDHFNSVLTRIAEYGIPCTTSSSIILCVVLLMLFESIEDECLIKSQTFSDLWNYITREGIQSIKTFSDFIAEEERENQITDEQSPLYLALRIYNEEEIPKLLKQYRIADTRNVYSLAADNVTKNGLLKGIESVQKKIPKKKYDLLMEAAIRITSEKPPLVTTETPSPGAVAGLSARKKIAF